MNSEAVVAANPKQVPHRQRPIIHGTSICCAVDSTRLAVPTTIAHPERSIVFLLPIPSNKSPHKMRPKPLQRASVPASVVACAIVAPFSKEISRESAIAVVPTAQVKIE